jgi:hypothetical protein
MPIQIDHLDSELEILPERSAARRPTPGGIAAPPAGSRGLRRQIVEVLEDELQRYLRSRG